MLVRKCDVCDHIIGDEAGYMIDIFKISMPKGTEVRTKTPKTSIEICSECERAMFGALHERMKKYVMGEEQEAEEDEE